MTYHTSTPNSHTLEKGEDIVRAISNNGITRVRQFGLYPLWTQGNLRRAIPSK